HHRLGPRHPCPDEPRGRVPPQVVDVPPVEPGALAGALPRGVEAMRRPPFRPPPIRPVEWVAFLVEHVLQLYAPLTLDAPAILTQGLYSRRHRLRKLSEQPGSGSTDPRVADKPSREPERDDRDCRRAAWSAVPGDPLPSACIGRQCAGANAHSLRIGPALKGGRLPRANRAGIRERAWRSSTLQERPQRWWSRP